MRSRHRLKLQRHGRPPRKIRRCTRGPDSTCNKQQIDLSCADEEPAKALVDLKKILGLNGLALRITGYCVPAAICRASPACLLICAIAAQAAEHHGQVLSNNLPVPGATVTATRDGKVLPTVTDAEGRYSFLDLTDGTWTITVEMPFFTSDKADIAIASGAPASRWQLTMLPLAQALSQVSVQLAAAEPALATSTAADKSGAAQPAAPATPAESSGRDEGLLLNGSTNNAATSQFSLAQAFGNTRSGSHSKYNGGLGIMESNAAFDARPYSLTGLPVPQGSYNQITAIATIGGPLNIPHLWRKGPNVGAQYEWTRNSNAFNQTGLVPTLAERTATAPAVDPVAQALLGYYPLPNVENNDYYNYELPVINGTHTDALQTRADRGIGTRGDSVSGLFAFQSQRMDQTSLFGFRDNTDTLGMDARINWSHRFARNISTNVNYSYSQLRSRVTPYFENRVNVAGEAGLTGMAQDPADWGPPTLVFSSGIASLTDAESQNNRNQTGSVGGTMQWSLGRHNITAGADLRRQEFNYFSQQDPRGTFTFTGQAFGSDFADFLHGVPDTAMLVNGNPDKYLRAPFYDLYVTDDWRVQPNLTLNYGVRWEYGAPLTEIKNRLANLDAAPGFGSVATVLADEPVGAVTGQRYPRSLLRPDRADVEPRLGLAWRPVTASSLLVRAGYGVYVDTSLYQNIAIQLAQQAPFAASVSANNDTCPQTLRTGPSQCIANTADTFGIDPNYRVGYAQTWQASVQRDLPAALQVVATYLGVKGTRGAQEYLPNTYPLGAANPCPSCPVGFLYRSSTGDSTREEVRVQLRRRLRSGLMATLQYIYSKSVDDDSVLGGQGPLAGGAISAAATPGVTTAQNWLDLKAERGLSTFDQRHLLSATLQYTTGEGLGGGTLISGWAGRLYKEWTVLNVLTAGSGKPETPEYLDAVNETGFSGSIRPDRTAASLYAASPGRYLNPAAFTAPQPGQWGSAGRNSITGPDELTLNTSLLRTFRLHGRYSLDARADANNVLNHVVFTSYNVTVDPTLTSPIFGLPVSTGTQRSLAFTARLRF